MHNASVAAAGRWLGDGWEWQLSWRREMESVEQDEASQLADILKSLCPDRYREDKWVWLKDNSMIYKVKSAYEFLTETVSEIIEDEAQRKVLRRMWRTAVPSKYLVLVWRLMRDGLPT